MKTNEKTKKEIKYLEKEFDKINKVIDLLDDRKIQVKPQGTDEVIIYDFSKINDIKKYYVDGADIESDLITRIENFLIDAFFTDNYNFAISVSTLIFNEINHTDNQ